MISEESYKLMQMRLAAGRKQAPAVPDDAAEDEGDLQDQIIAYCHTKGWWVLWSRMDLKTTTPLGTPDLIIFANAGRVIIVEAKRRDGKLRPDQLGVKLKLESLGHTVHVVRSMKEFMSAITEIT